MTCHRLVRCRPHDLITHAAQRLAETAERPSENAPRWFPCGPPRGGAMITWRQHWPGTPWTIDCSLEVEQGANGVLAHLSTAPARRPGPLPTRLASIMLKRWSSHFLSVLATETETSLRPSAGPRGADQRDATLK